MIDYLAPAPFSPSPDAGVGTPTPAGPPSGTPLPGGAPPAPGGGAPPNPLAILAALAAAKGGAPGGGAPMPAPGGPVGPPNGIPGAGGPGAPAYPQPQHPGTMKYTNVTQADGTVLLRVLNPDGSPGPVVQIVKPPTAKGGGK